MSRAPDPLVPQTVLPLRSPVWPGARVSQRPLGCVLHRCPSPGREREGPGVTYLLGHQAGDAHGPPHPALLGPGLQSPCSSRLPGRGRHGGLGSPQPACPGARGPEVPHLRSSSSPSGGCAPGTGGSRDSLWREARVAGAGPQGRGHPGTERGQRPAWLRLPMASWCGPAAGVLRFARASPAAAAPRSEPRLLRPAPPPPRSPPPPARPASGPPPPQRSGLRLQPLLQPAPLPLPGSLACHHRLMVSPTPPPRGPVPSQPESGRHPEMGRRPGDGRAGTHARTDTELHAQTHTQATSTHRHTAVGMGVRQTPGLQVGTTARARREGHGQPDSGPGLGGNIVDSGPRGWTPGRDPESQRQWEQGQEEGWRPVPAALSRGPAGGDAVEAAGGSSRD